MERDLNDSNWVKFRSTSRVNLLWIVSCVRATRAESVYTYIYKWNWISLAEKFVACESEWAAGPPGRTDETSAASECPPVRYSHGNLCRPVPCRIRETEKMKNRRKCAQMRGSAQICIMSKITIIISETCLRVLWHVGGFLLQDASENEHFPLRFTVSFSVGK